MQWNGTGHVSVAVESPSDVYYPESSLPTIQTVEIDFNPDYEKIMMKLYLDSKPTTVNGYWSINFCGTLGSEISWFFFFFLIILGERREKQWLRESIKMWEISMPIVNDFTWIIPEIL